MLSIMLVASIAVAVVLGDKTKINTGFFCIAFASRQSFQSGSELPPK